MLKYAAYKHPNMYRYFKLNASDSTLVKNDFLVRALFCSSNTMFNERMTPSTANSKALNSAALLVAKSALTVTLRHLNGIECSFVKAKLN